MESLAVKFRPKNFSEVCHQSSIVKILQRQIDTDSFKNVFLFCGASGCGKTTCARIFAKEINKGQGEPIEIDAASNNGVDNVKSIIRSAQERSIDSKYKVYIIDECFARGTKVKTPSGDINIEDVRAGDTVCTLEGNKKVLETHKIKSNTDNMVTVVLSNGKQLHVTKDHYILTTEGWIPAQNLAKGDLLLDYQTVSNMWKNIPHGLQNMLEEMRKNSELAASARITSSEDVYSQLCCLWKNVGRYARTVNSNVFSGMLFNIAVNKTGRALCFRSWDGAQEISVRTSSNNCGIRNTYSRAESTPLRAHEEEQSNVSRRKHSEDVECQRMQWDLASVEGTTWGEWTLYSGADAFVRELGQFLGARVPCENSCEKNERESLPYIIQSRPCLSYETVSSRGGWQRASVEKLACRRREENNMFEQVRVDSIEVYKRGDLNECSGSDTKDLFVYDLTVEDSPTYFANGVLVHNCHSLTNQAWQAFLKCIEEPPTYTIFIFCTTDPQKIPETIKNRVQRFRFNRIGTEQIKERLAYICRMEGFTNYEESVDYLSRMAEGGMRAGITFLDKCSSYSTDLNINNVLAALGNYSYDTFFSLINNMIDGNEAEVLSIISKFYDEGNDLKLFVDQFLNFCMDVTKYSLFKSTEVTRIPSSMEPQLQGSTNFDNASRYYTYVIDKLLVLKNMLKNDNSPRSTIEILFLQITRCA